MNSDAGSRHDNPSQPNARAEIRLEDVSCVFEHRGGRVVKAMDGVSLVAPPGQFVALVGRSGCGKTTLLRVLAGLQKPTSGRAYVGGQLIEGPGTMPMAFQKDTVFPWMHVRDNVEYSLRLRGHTKQEKKKVSDRWLEAVGLLDYADSWPRELSGGMRKRVALAAVLATGSQVWLMDEPFGSLDYFTRRDLHDLILDLWSETAKTVFFVTHDIEEALILADRIVVIYEGRVVGDLVVDLARPRTEAVRATPQAVELTMGILHGLRLDAGPSLTEPCLEDIKNIKLTGSS